MNTAHTTRSISNQPESSALGMTHLEKSMRHTAKSRPQHPGKSIIYEQHSSKHKPRRMRHSEKPETSNQQPVSAFPQ
jgi:hypothetical protein